MSDVLDFREKAEEVEALISQCDCDNCSFILYEGGLIQCSNCGATQNDTGEHYLVIKRWTRKQKQAEKEKQGWIKRLMDKVPNK